MTESEPLNVTAAVTGTLTQPKVNLTSDDSVWDEGPSWSPDGRRITFMRIIGGNKEIYVMDGDGGNQVNLTNDSAGDLYPSWSPNGLKIEKVLAP